MSCELGRWLDRQQMGCAPHRGPHTTEGARFSLRQVPRLYCPIHCAGCHGRGRPGRGGDRDYQPGRDRLLINFDRPIDAASLDQSDATLSGPSAVAVESLSS